MYGSISFDASGIDFQVKNKYRLDNVTMHKIIENEMRYCSELKTAGQAIFIAS